jgi:hypothetical protein
MKYFCIVAGLLVAANAHAAAPPSDTAEPAVVTSPAATSPTATPAPAASEAAQGRGNPRRLELQADPASAPATPVGTDAQPGGQPPARGSADRIQLEATQITGNAELPRVMYVVPWKRPELGDLNGRPAKSLLDEVLAPVDRDVFRRQNRYYDALQPDAVPAVPPVPEGEK